MLGTILNLFGKSPFAPLKAHMEKVAGCVGLLPELFDALEEKDYGTVELVGTKISELEHDADIVKMDIRKHTPKGIYLPIERSQLFEILSMQDSIADAAEDAAVLTTLKPLVFFDSFKGTFKMFLNKNIEAFEVVKEIIQEMDELLEASFGGMEAKKVRGMVESVAFKEHEVDVMQRDLLKALFEAEKEMSYSTFDLWQRIFQTVGSISNTSENLANKVGMTLELK